MNYTLYLSECSTSCSQALAGALSTLEDMSDSEPVPEEDEDMHKQLEEWRSTIRNDIEYLTGLLTGLDTQILNLRTMV